MSDLPAEDLALAAETLSDDEVISALLSTVGKLGAITDSNMSKRMLEIQKKVASRIPLRRKLEKNPELARELIADYPLYASTSALTYPEMIDICVALNLDEEEIDD